jgi:hypothetical protein
VMLTVIVGLLHWKPSLQPNGVPHPEFHYPDYDGRKLLVTGPALTAGLLTASGEAVDAEVSFYPRRSRQAAELKCDGFARLWVDNGKPTLLGANVDLPENLWEDLWTKALIPSAYGTLFLGVPDGKMPPNENIPIVDPIIQFNINHPKN